MPVADAVAVVAVLKVAVANKTRLPFVNLPTRENQLTFWKFPEGGPVGTLILCNRPFPPVAATDLLVFCAADASISICKTE